MSQKKVRNATEAVSRVFSLDRSLNGVTGETLDCYNTMQILARKISHGMELMNGHLRIGLSRERVRQVGLVALEKLKYAARKKRLEAMLVKH